MRRAQTDGKSFVARLFSALQVHEAAAPHSNILRDWARHFSQNCLRIIANLSNCKVYKHACFFFFFFQFALKAISVYLEYNNSNRKLKNDRHFIPCVVNSRISRNSRIRRFSRYIVRRETDSGIGTPGVPISHFEIMVGGCYASLRSRPVLARGRRWRTTV